MRFIFCSDLHGNKIVYEKLLEYSIEHGIRSIIIGGDLCPHLHLDVPQAIKCQGDFIRNYLSDFCKRAAKSSISLFLMMGNDDFRVNMGLLENLECHKNVKLLHNESHRLDGYSLVGYSFVPQMPFLLKDWEKLDTKDSKPITPPEEDVRTAPKESGTIESDLIKIKELSEPKNTLYVIHTPPFGTKLDITYSGEHVGSRALREFIVREQPPLALHGHIHESMEMSCSFIDKLGRTICVNPGSKIRHGLLSVCIIDTKELNSPSHLTI